MEKSECIGLIFGCSKRDENPNCPLLKARKISDVRKRINYWESLSDLEKQKIIDFHKKCTNE